MKKNVENNKEMLLKIIDNSELKSVNIHEALEDLVKACDSAITCAPWIEANVDCDCDEFSFEAKKFYSGALYANLCINLGEDTLREFFIQQEPGKAPFVCECEFEKDKMTKNNADVKAFSQNFNECARVCVQNIKEK